MKQNEKMIHLGWGDNFKFKSEKLGLINYKALNGSYHIGPCMIELEKMLLEQRKFIENSAFPLNWRKQILHSLTSDYYQLQNLLNIPNDTAIVIWPFNGEIETLLPLIAMLYFIKEKKFNILIHETFDQRKNSIYEEKIMPISSIRKITEDEKEMCYQLWEAYCLGDRNYFIEKQEAINEIMWLKPIIDLLLLYPDATGLSPSIKIIFEFLRHSDKPQKVASLALACLINGVYSDSIYFHLIKIFSKKYGFLDLLNDANYPSKTDVQLSKKGRLFLDSNNVKKCIDIDYTLWWGDKFFGFQG